MGFSVRSVVSASLWRTATWPDSVYWLVDRVRWIDHESGGMCRKRSVCDRSAGYPLDRTPAGRRPAAPATPPKGIGNRPVRRLPIGGAELRHRHQAFDAPAQDQRVTSISQLAKDIVLSLLGLVAGKAVGLRVEDYYQQGKRWWLRLQEKGGKHHAVPVHHKAEAYLDAAGIAAEKDAPLWRSMPRPGGLSARRLSRVDVFRMIKRRVKTVGLGEANCHTFRATGITAYLLNGGTLERAQVIAAHESPRTTKLYDRTADEVTFEDIDKIGI